MKIADGERTLVTCAVQEHLRRRGRDSDNGLVVWVSDNVRDYIEIDDEDGTLTRYFTDDTGAIESMTIRRTWNDLQPDVEVTRVNEDAVVALPTVVTSPPGARMSAFATAWFSPQAVERVFAPIVDDYRLEYFDGLKRNEGATKLRVIAGRHWAGFVLAAIYVAVSGIGKVVKAIRGTG